MASAPKMNDDDELLSAGVDDIVIQQPRTQQSYPAHPPAYFPPYNPGAGVPMDAIGRSTVNNTTVIINQTPLQTYRSPRVWSSGLCDCCDDMGACLLGTFCPCILASQVATDMDESCCVPCCVPGWMIVLRAKLRAENNIQGSVMDDCCKVCFCGQCVLCQLSRELKFIRMTRGPEI